MSEPVFTDEVWLAALDADLPPGSWKLTTTNGWFRIGTTAGVDLIAEVKPPKVRCVCGHAYDCHGDRAIAACVPPGNAYWDHYDDEWIPNRCGCTGWRRV